MKGKNAAYPKAVDDLKIKKELPQKVELRQNKYLNNRIEQDNRFIKRLTRTRNGVSLVQYSPTNNKRIRGYEHAHVLDKLWESKKEMFWLAQNSYLKFSEWWLNESKLIGKLCY